MHRLMTIGALLLLVGAAELAATGMAAARGGGDFMNSFGYQRRLQESRGYVTDQSSPIFAPPTAPTPAPAPARRSKPRR